MRLEVVVDVLSAGHASMLLYAMLHLTGVRAVNPKYETLGELSVTLEDIKRFRQLDSKCPGHPEYRLQAHSETRAPDTNQARTAGRRRCVLRSTGTIDFGRDPSTSPAESRRVRPRAPI